jgi:hypothetical protein
MKIIFPYLKEKFIELRGEPLHVALLLAAWAGLAMRVVYAFTSNPQDYLSICDSTRHKTNATHLLGTEFSFIDQIGYQIWLAAMFLVFGQSKLGVSLFTALLSTVTPYIWLLWLRECIPSKTAQLAGFAAISLLLPWITIYSFFMTETILLPSLGLALWFTWRAKRRQTLRDVLCAALGWAWVLNIKITILPAAVIALAWLLISIWKEQPRRSFALQSATVSTIFCFAMLVNPAMNDWKFGTAWLYPPGGIHSWINRIFLLSGAQKYQLIILLGSSVSYQTGYFDSHAFYYQQEQFPFIKWPAKRSGHVDITLRAGQGFSLFAPDISQYLPAENGSQRKTPAVLLENTVVFFCGEEWPDCCGQDILQRLQTPTRWLWIPMFLLTIALALIKRRINVLVVMTVFTALCFCFQDWGAMGSGRYRKPWEGVAIAALISMIVAPRASSKELIPNRDKGNNASQA